MERYSEYKDSGVKWLGEIPSHWEICRFKNFASLITTPSKDSHKIGLENIESASGKFHQSDSEFEGNGVQFQENDIVYGKLRPYLQKVWLATFSGNAVGDFFVFRTNKKISEKYLQYLMLSKSFTDDVNGSTYGAKMPRVSSEYILTMRCTLPSKSEQNAIVFYLDSVTARIDEAIAQQQKMIDLLNERKQIIINKAVTKGLDPKVKMKPSGIDWIGEIPEHWDVKRGKFLFRIVNDLSTTGDEELLSVSDKTGVTPRSMKNVNMFMSESLVGYKKCRVGDVCSNIMWMWHGAVGVSKYEGVISPSYGVYRQIKKNYLDSFLDMLLRIPKLVNYYSVLSTGLTESRLRLYPSDFLNIYFFVPPIDEQKDIELYLKKISIPIDFAIENAEKQISLLQERKQIIINDVVTGKVKVV